jgi:Holliday junction resolvase RusA-like endonuclease
VIFTIPGNPVGKGRPRATTINGMARMYTPKKTASYETLVVMAYTQAGGVKLEGSLHMHIKATFEMPLSWSMKKRKLMDGAFCEKKIDADNIAKVVCDGLNGVAYHDDRQVVDLHVVKRWGQDGAVEVSIESASQLDNTLNVR